MLYSLAIGLVYNYTMSSLDLNLLRTLVAVRETGSLTRSAELLRVAQPTVSHSLGRLRRHFDDRLFLRSPTGMQPTELADQLYSAFKPALTNVDLAVADAVQFDPAISTRRFRLCLTDLGEIALLPAILQRIGEDAPLVEVEVTPMDITQVEGWVGIGAVDAAIASTPLDASLASEVLLHEDYICLLRDDHPLALRGLSLKDFQAARHAVVATTTGHRLAEMVMRELGITQQATVTLPHFAALPHILNRTDLLAVVPRGLAEAFIGRWALTAIPLPFDVPEFDVKIYWQRREREPAALAWFHQMIADAVGRERSQSG